MNFLAQYHWMEIWSPIFLAGLVMLAGLYTGKKGASGRQRAKFLTGLVLIYVTVGSPLHLYARDVLFSAYILQNSILYLVVPPLLISGTPTAWIKPVLSPRPVKAVVKVLTYPWLTAIVFNIGFSIFLLPTIFNPVQDHPVMAVVCQVFFFIAAVLMWWSILSPLPELNPLTEMKRIFYMFITALMLTPIAMVLLFAGDALYPAYAPGSDMVSFLTPKYDQQLGAGILKTFQLTAYGVALTILVFRWVKGEKYPEDPEVPERGKVIPFKKVR